MDAQLVTSHYHESWLHSVPKLAKSLFFLGSVSRACGSWIYDSCNSYGWATGIARSPGDGTEFKAQNGQYDTVIWPKIWPGIPVIRCYKYL